MTSERQVNPAVCRIRAPLSLTEQITQGVEKPFRTVIDVSSGDPHRAGMPPISFVRQVLAVCLYPELLNDNSLPLDVRQRAHRLLDGCAGGSVGSYSVSSCGLPLVQKSVAEFITRRDGGVASHAENITVSHGSQKTLSLFLHLMDGGDFRTGVLTPVPCPHTLPMLMDDVGVRMVPYHLVEERGWAVELDELHRALNAARGRCQPRAIYISNPGNPTGHVQDRETMEKVIRFAATERLILLAEEVNQDSVFGGGAEFISYKKVLSEMDTEYAETVELLSFHSISTACMGECGLRGGYMESINMDPAVKEYLRNMQASGSPAVLPQLVLDVMSSPPTAGDPSYETYTQEVQQILKTLSQNAQRACDFLNDLEGMSCQRAQAGLFLYPRLQLPPLMIKQAEVLGMEADELYCQRLLDEEGVCVGAGCENGQDDKNFHIRLCVLAPPAALEEVLARLRSFHLRLLDEFP